MGSLGFWGIFAGSALHVAAMVQPLTWHKAGGGDNPWKVQDGYMEVVSGAGDIESDQVFNDFHLHVEFWVPHMPEHDGQERGNSGVYLLSLYEIQILDSFGKALPDAQDAGALYKVAAPLVNASFAPRRWQTFEIDFRAPETDASGSLNAPGEVSVVHNGHLVLDRIPITRGTGSASRDPLTAPGPIRVQDHGCPVRFRNIFVTFGEQKNLAKSETGTQILF